MSDKTKAALAGIIAIAALGGFAVFVAYLIDNMDMSEQEWLRTTYVYAGVEAVAFAAVGWLFGREVHRERADEAEERAKEAEGKAVKGEALARAVLAKHQVRGAGGGPFRTMEVTERSAVQSMDLDELVIMADQVMNPAS